MAEVVKKKVAKKITGVEVRTEEYQKDRSLWEWYVFSIKSALNFKTRARRREYWSFTLVNVLVSFLLSFVMSVCQFSDDAIDWVTSIYSLFIILPSLALCIRRLHDIDKSGWWYLFIFLPIIGWIVLLVFFLQKGTMGKNQYGA